MYSGRNKVLTLLVGTHRGRTVSMLASVIALAACGGDGGVPVTAWTFEVSGLNPGAVAEVEVTYGSETESTLLALEAGKEVILKNVRAGTYNIALKDVQFGGKTWFPKDKSLKLALRDDGTARNVATNRVVSTGLYEIRLAYTANVLGGAIAEPVYPTLTPAAARLYQCDSATAGSCTVLDSTVGSELIAVGNNRVYTMHKNKIYSCDPNQPESCSYLNDAGGNNIKAMIYANNSLYAGLSNGILWKCDPNVPDACSDFNNAGNTQVLSLAYGNDRLYAGLKNGILWNCDPNTANSCNDHAQAGGPINALTYGNDRVYAGIDDDQFTLWSCDPDPAKPNFCHDQAKAKDWGLWGKSAPGSIYLTMLYANGRVYSGSSGFLWDCDPNTIDSCDAPYPYVGATIGFNDLQFASATLFSSAHESCGAPSWHTDLYAYDTTFDSFYLFQTLRSGTGTSC